MAIISTENAKNVLKHTGEILEHATADLLAGSDFISRTIGMNNSYEDIMFLVQALGREPVSLLGKDYLFIFDHVRRNYQQGTVVPSTMYGGGEYGCTKFVFYKEKPTVKFADVYNDPLNLLDRWTPNFIPNSTVYDDGELFYAESNDNSANNIVINSAEGNIGTASGKFVSSFQGHLTSCDLIKKSNDNFIHGKYNTLIARFHTNTDESMRLDNPTQTAVSKGYGMSHGRNLLKKKHRDAEPVNGYNNPYCRVWTYHHQYHQMLDAIRPFGDASSAAELEEKELSGEYKTVGFRTTESKQYNVEGGSKRLDKHGVLNYENGFVNIAPTAKIKDYFEGKEDDKGRKSVSIKRCMFSIENLAWRDEKAKPDQFEAYGLSAEQRGPLGGRIMWFPPYDISFNENVRVKWNPNEFIGRGENIYTYTNTERNGNLSFTMVIDHPSILDYWTGHDAPRGDLKNKGEDLKPGNSGGVDGVNNQEQTLLRFFAGCDILSAKPQMYWSREKKPGNAPEEVIKEDVKENPDNSNESSGITQHTLCCVLYYPNNYSGVDDWGNAYVNPVHYLMNGIGAQKYVTKSKCRDCGHEWYPSEAELIEAKSNGGKLKCPTCGKRNVEKNLEEADINTTISVAPSSDGSEHGGYEINGNISIVTEPLSGNAAKKKSYSDPVTAEKKAQFLTDKDGNKKSVKYGDKEYTLAKIVDYDHAMPYAQMENKLWHRMRWYYRVDSKYKDDKLTAPESYIDTACNNLNGSGYELARTTDGSIKIPEESDTFHLISFQDLFFVLEGEANKVITQRTGSDKHIQFVKELMDPKNNGIKIKKIRFKGHASSAGNTTSNSTLSTNRAETLKRWMMDKGFPGQEDGKDPEVTTGNQSKSNHVDNGKANGLLDKIWRSASVWIEYDKEDVTNAKPANDTIQTSGGSPVMDKDKNEDGTSKGFLPQKQRVAKQSSSNSISPGRLDAVQSWLRNTAEGQQILEKGYPVEKEVIGDDGKKRKEIEYHKIDENSFTIADAERITGKNFTDNKRTDYDDSILQQGSVNHSIVKRYDNEGEFFKLLETKDPFMHHLITDKIKYFDPAYHAISPEGFNARLTFLHQCTRQGATIGNSDNDAKTAWNLAFGRPPVCVLRLGDFYYTKILINGLTINYDNPTWDLNPEGIGVMPMFAKVNLDFTFIGGSDLAGPIARLQNAVSFNYYANTSVYDNRAERVEYDPAKTGKEIVYKPYNYPNRPGRNTADEAERETEDL